MSDKLKKLGEWLFISSGVPLSTLIPVEGHRIFSYYLSHPEADIPSLAAKYALSGIVMLYGLVADFYLASKIIG